MTRRCSSAGSRRRDCGHLVQPRRRHCVRRARSEDSIGMTTHLPPPEVELGDIGAIAEPADSPPGTEPVARSNWQLFRRRFFRHKMAVVAIIVVALLFIVCFGANVACPLPEERRGHRASSARTARARSTGSAPTISASDQLSQILYARPDLAEDRHRRRVPLDPRRRDRRARSRGTSDNGPIRA